VNLAWQVNATFILGLLAIGAVVGSFLNVCIYRIPWQKSVIWPGSHCPKCSRPIAPEDNVPVLSWLALRGECRRCGGGIAVRYPLVEALVALLFAAVYFADVMHGLEIGWGPLPAWIPLRVAYHLVLVALLVAATFIDYDLTIIPDEVTVTGMIVGIGLGTLVPAVRPDPVHAATMWDGFKVGMTGLLVGGGLTQLVRFTGSAALRREAMGFGDVTLMAMIGSFLGWQAAVLTFFIAPFFGLGHALAKTVVYVGKRLSGKPSSSADREIPFGPYLSMAALALLLTWFWFWPNWAKPRFALLSMLFSSW
jgi:leader peptidase (prepilin peptidase) / N-methyltransferase